MRKRILIALNAAALALASSLSQAGDGASSFAQYCQMCHQAGAVGLAGAFPRLAGRVAAISAKPAGRAYLIDVLTFGMAGTITVDKQPLMGVMPAFAQLAEDEIAAVLSYVQTLGDAPAKSPLSFTAEEVATGRARSAKTAADVFAERQVLEKAKIVQ